MTRPNETRLTASTLGTPGERLDTVLGWLGDAGIRAIELRLSAGEFADPAMTGRERLDLRARLDDGGVAVSGIASYVRVASDANDEMVTGALAHALQFAADLGAPVVRVFPGAPTHPAAYDRLPELIEPQAVVDERAARRLDSVSAIATDLGAYPVLETHDSHPRGEDIRRILDVVHGPVGAVWDLMHPWRVGEPIERTWELLAPWIEDDRGGVQVKDANLPGDATPLAIGAGTLPTEEFGRLLGSSGFRGTVCLEWERTWHPDAVRLDEALVSTRAWYDRHFAAVAV
ncbi:sugar phosphate isomerase/epimerase family protein [Lacisediminihabitans sp.]|uniref:sugar phosphate isomerase/epimerase family protein n=1 Tax=Lacisediminihabitans sp. TaxID=2787631 RepID=UPI00374C9E04